MTESEREHRTAGGPFTNGIPAEALSELQVPEQPPEPPAEKPARRKKAKVVTFRDETKTTPTTDNDPLSVHPEPPAESPAPPESPTTQGTESAPADSHDETGTDDDDEEDLLGGILAASADMKKTIGAITKAANVISDERTVGAFVEFGRGIDELAAVKMAFQKSDSSAREEWRKMNLAQVEAKLQEWGAQKFLATLTSFKRSKVDVLEPLWRFYDTIVRPADDVESHKGLQYLFLGNQANQAFENTAQQVMGTKNSLCGQGLAVCYIRSFPKGDSNPDKIEVGRFRFVPAQGNSMARLAWPYLQEAKVRADEEYKKRETEFNELRAQAQGLTPVDIDAGESGTFFLVIDQDRFQGLLMEAQTIKGVVGPSVRVVKSVGFPQDETGWMRARDPFRLKEAAKAAFQEWYKL